MNKDLFAKNLEPKQGNRVIVFLIYFKRNRGPKAMIQNSSIFGGRSVLDHPPGKKDAFSPSYWFFCQAQLKKYGIPAGRIRNSPDVFLPPDLSY
jgi:hypothetical protein